MSLFRARLERFLVVKRPGEVAGCCGLTAGKPSRHLLSCGLGRPRCRRGRSHLLRGFLLVLLLCPPLDFVSVFDFIFLLELEF